MEYMKKLYIVANWKSNKTESEAKDWLSAISRLRQGSSGQANLKNKEIIVCPSFIHLPAMKAFIEERKLPIKLGAQNISSFDEGAYTGEINGKQIREFANYVLIGHSERRLKLFEDESLIKEKVLMAKKYKLIPIFFAQDKKTFIPKDVSIVVYEPPSSISPGIPDTPENANQAAIEIKNKNSVEFVLYGGSVTSTNVKGFTEMPSIEGAIPGRASLDAKEFYKIIQNA